MYYCLFSLSEHSHSLFLILFTSSVLKDGFEQITHRAISLKSYKGIYEDYPLWKLLSKNKNSNQLKSQIRLQFPDCS